jgi:lipopolysaccharide export system permease protein
MMIFVQYGAATTSTPQHFGTSTHDNPLMIKKIDKLILSSFIGPFILTFLVVVFILLTQHMLKYFDDIIGKDLGWSVLGTLLFYFAIFMIPVAMPLAVLLSSLITFGNLGEHFELTAVKSLGISLVRSLAPIFCFVLLLTGFAFWANNNLVPRAALEAYSLMYDIKQKKPALDLREGAFYNSIPDMSIKVNRRLADQKTLRGVIIYDHRGSTGNKTVIMADSGKMYTILGGQYLKFELFKGFRYTEGASTDRDISGRQSNKDNSSKTKFSEMQVVFDLSSFGLIRTDKKWFQGNRIMRNMRELDSDMDSVNNEINVQKIEVYRNKENLFKYHFTKDTIKLPTALRNFKRVRDSVALQKAKAADPKGAALKDAMATTTPAVVKKVFTGDEKETKAISDSLFALTETPQQINMALNNVRMVQTQFQNARATYEEHDQKYKEFQIQWHKILSNSVACIVMFLIGAPLGAIIKKGGLGVPVLMSIFFFIVFYLLTMTGEKWAKQGHVSVPLGIWASDVILLIVGLLFLRQARVDARLFDADFYNVVWDKAKVWFARKRAPKPAAV